MHIRKLQINFVNFFGDFSSFQNTSTYALSLHFEKAAGGLGKNKVVYIVKVTKTYSMTLINVTFIGSYQLFVILK